MSHILLLYREKKEIYVTDEQLEVLYNSVI